MRSRFCRLVWLTAAGPLGHEVHLGLWLEDVAEAVFLCVREGVNVRTLEVTPGVFANALIFLPSSHLKPWPSGLSLQPQ